MSTETSVTKPVLYIDMDNTLVDFVTAFGRVGDVALEEYKGNEDDIPGIFALMEPMPGAIEAVHALAEHYDVYVLSTAPWANPSAWSDKVGWIQRHFGSHEDSVLYKRLILSHHKNLNRGDFLVDDRLHKNGADRFVGTALEFGSDEWPDWATVVAYLSASASASVAPSTAGEVSNV
jgi:5'(3')-deoxyribonucleotidase